MDAPETLAWTPARIARFWNYWSARDSQETYFARQVGGGVVEFAEHVRSLRGLRVLDFGSGPGHLVPHLLRRGALVSAVDYSQQSIDEANLSFGGDPCWSGGKLFVDNTLPWPVDSFDAAFCLETIEHLHDDDCRRIFDELLRVLRPGGFIVFTTPNEENLADQHVYCPNCNSQFHRWQHLRSWSSTDLSRQLEQHGYDVRYCQAIDFQSFQTPPRRKLRLSTLRRALRHAMYSLSDRVAPREFPRQRTFVNRVRRGLPANLAAVAFKPVPRSAAA